MGYYKIKIISILCFFILFSLNPLACTSENKIKNRLTKYHGFNIEDLTFEDAGYKGKNIIHSLEWWYFDAVFTNNYSIEYHIDIFSKLDIGFAVSMLNIYQNGTLISHARQMHSLKEFNYETKESLLWNLKEQKLTGIIDEQGNWIFNITVTMNNNAIDLEFKSNTQGWKSKILNMWCWGIIQPKADVSGTLTIDDETKNVVGHGYQEHGWDGKIPQVRGWYWGKIYGETLNIIWTNVIKYPWKQYLMLVVNEDKGNYLNVPVKDIHFKLTDYKTIDGEKIPTTFHFNVDNKLVYIDVMAKANTITHQQSLGFFNYWRYHCNVTGILKYNSTSEYIDSVQIMDLTKFW